MSIETAFTGRTAGAPELRTSAAGKPWTRFGVAVGEGDDVQWVQVACFGEIAQRAAERLGKGDRCYVEGTLRLDEWTDSQGVPRAGLKVAAWKVEPIGQIGQRKPKRSKAPASTIPETCHQASHASRAPGHNLKEARSS
jgi:single-stranded DNA-binding protein